MEISTESPDIKGVVSWDDPTTSDIQSSASTLAKSLVKMTPFILSPAATFRQVTVNLVDVGLWTVGGKTLVLATNTNYFTASVSLKQLGLPSLQPLTEQVLDTGAKIDQFKGVITLDSVGTGGFIVSA